MRIAINPIFDSPALVFLVGGALLALLLLPPAFSGVTTARRRKLMLLRAAVILLLLIAMLRPSLVRTEQREVTTSVAVLLDTSRSMQVEDVGDESRFEAMQSAARRFASLTGGNDESLEFEFYEFDSQLRLIDQTDNDVQLGELPEGEQTDIGQALDQVLQRKQAQRLGAVILMSDGAVRTYAPVVDLQRVATEFARQGTALYPVTFGKSRDQSQARDVALSNLPDQLDVFAKNRIPIKATLQVAGYVGRGVPVTMTVDEPTGDKRSFGPVILTAREDGELLDVEFAYVPEQPGQYKLTLSAAAQADEQVTDNNEITAYLNVREGGLRVLFVCGNLGWQEQKFIRRSLATSEDINVDFRWIDTRRQDSWPSPMGSTLEDGTYDVILISDVPAAALGTVQCRRLAAHTGDGKGLMMLGGKFSFGPGNYSATALAEVLPVVMTRFERQDFDAEWRDDVHIPGPVSMVPRRPHFVTRISSEDEPVTWQELPSLMGANRFARLTPTGRVLVESVRGDSLLVASEYGLGRVLAFAADSTYRWYRKGFQSAHKRFWRQSVLWLAKKDDEEGQRIALAMDQRRFAAGSEAAFEVSVEGDENDAADDTADNSADDVTSRPVVRAFLVAPDGQKTSVTVFRKPDGRLAGTTGQLTQPGEYNIEAQLVINNAVADNALMPFQVLDEDIEMSDPAANPSQMAMLAQITEGSGGRAVAPEQLDDVLAEVQDRSKDATTDYESKWQLTDTPWDAWSMFLVVVGLLSTDWYLRKKWHMV